jgi:uncharacterized protein YicC (UPF0701 family)
MEDPEQAITRLLGALEVLFDQEAIQVANADHAGVLGAQERITPIVERLSHLCSESANAAIRAKVAVLLAKRRVTEDGLAAHIARIRGELNRTHAAQHRLARIAPAYLSRGGSQAPQRLRAVI